MLAGAGNVGHPEHSSAMRHALKVAAKFVVALVLTTVVCTLAWEVVNERLYDCTDAFGFDYWQPGDWVHGGVAVIPQIVHHRSMSEPDTIKEGWSVAGLWRLWYFLVAISLAVSALAGFVPWNPRLWRRWRYNPSSADNSPSD